jgi:hypothetical protein
LITKTPITKEKEVKMKKVQVIVLSFLVCLIFGVITSANAQQIRVSQESAAGAGDFDDNVLGFINPFDSALTTAEFYQYGVPNGASYNGELNGGPDPISSKSQIFLVSASDGLSLVVVHDNPNDGSGGSTQTRWNLSGDTAAQVLADDPGEPVAVSAGGTQFDSTKNWLACCTDGYAIGYLEGYWEMLGQFVNLPSGITNWDVVSSDFSNISLVLDPGRRVRLDTIVEVSFDIKPGSCPNPINVKSKGVLPAAIMGTDSFDVTQIDPATLRLEGVAPLRWAYVDVGEPFEPFTGKEDCYYDCVDCSCADGNMDLVFHFKTQEVVDALGTVEDEDCLVLQITGELNDDTLFVGEDVVRVLVKGKQK